jgi:hypothetical protein
MRHIGSTLRPLSEGGGFQLLDEGFGVVQQMRALGHGETARSVAGVVTQVKEVAGLMHEIVVNPLSAEIMGNVVSGETGAVKVQFIANITGKGLLHTGIKHAGIGTGLAAQRL